MRLLHPAPLLLAVALLVVSAATAPALININLPIAKIYESVKAVAVASVVSVNPENRVIELKTSEQLKGAPVGETFRVQIAAPAELIAKIATGQPLVIMVGEDLGKPVALILVADTWLLAEALPALSRDGRTLTGNAAAEDAPQLTLRLVGQDTIIAKADILSREKSPISLMPEGLLKALSHDEVRDLLAYLRTTSQVPLPQP
jgi:hypothetical protein